MKDHMSLTLTQNLKEWCKAENIKYQSADDLLHSEDLTESQKQWVMDYIKIWDLIND